jgi:hypothetical protein
MSEDAYALVAFLTVLAYAGVLWHRWKARRAMRRLLRLLEEQEAARAKEATAEK